MNRARTEEAEMEGIRAGRGGGSGEDGGGHCNQRSSQGHSSSVEPRKGTKFYSSKSEIICIVQFPQ